MATAQPTGPYPTGTMYIPPGIISRTQTVIPRYANGVSIPAGQLIGQGPSSTLAGSSTTKDQTVPYGVITEGIGAGTALWQAQVRDLTYQGYSANNWVSGSQTVDAAPQVNNKTSPNLDSGLKLAGGGGFLGRVTIYGIPGTACFNTRNGSALNVGPYGRLKWDVQNLNIRRVFRGLHMDGVDSTVENVEVEAFRDYGVRLGTYQTTGAVQFARIHAFGGGMAAADNNSTIEGYGGMKAGFDGAAIWIDGDGCHGIDCYGENAYTGLLIRGSHNMLEGYRGHTNFVSSVNFSGAQNNISHAWLAAGYIFSSTTYPAIGVIFANQNNTIADSTITVLGASTAISISNGTAQTVRNVYIDSYGNSTGIGVAPTATLDNCVMDISMAGGAIGLDLCTGGSVGSSEVSGKIDLITGGTNRIGYGNKINIRVDGTVTKWGRLPTGWSQTVKKTTNDIRIDGIRYYPANDEF